MITAIILLLFISSFHLLFAIRTQLYFSLDDFAVLAYFKTHPTSEMVRQFLIRGDIWGFHKILGYLDLRLLFHFFGVSAFPYILNNHLLHVGNVLLLFLISKYLTGDNLKAFFFSLVFNSLYLLYFSNVHEYLVTLLSLGSVYCYVRYSRYHLSLLFFALALLTKEVAIFVPLILFALVHYQKKPWRNLLPFFYLGILFASYQLAFMEGRAKLPATHPYTITFFLPTIWRNLRFYLNSRWLILLGVSLVLFFRRRTLLFLATALLTLGPALILVNRHEIYYLYLPLAYLCLFLALTLPSFRLKTIPLYLILFVLLGGRGLLPPIARHDYPNWQKDSVDRALGLVESTLTKTPNAKEINFGQITLERDAQQMLEQNAVSLFLPKPIAQKYRFSFDKETNILRVVY